MQVCGGECGDVEEDEGMMRIIERVLVQKVVERGEEEIGEWGMGMGVQDFEGQVV